MPSFQSAHGELNRIRRWRNSTGKQHDEQRVQTATTTPIIRCIQPARMSHTCTQVGDNFVSGSWWPFELSAPSCGPLWSSSSYVRETGHECSRS